LKCTILNVLMYFGLYNSINVYESENTFRMYNPETLIYFRFYKKLPDNLECINTFQEVFSSFINTYWNVEYQIYFFNNRFVIHPHEGCKFKT